MITIRESVEEIIGNSPFLEENIAEGIINLSSLSRKIKPEVEARLGKKVQASAIVMALKRLPLSVSAHANQKILDMMNHLGNITVRPRISYHTYQNSESLGKNQMRLLEVLSKRDNVFYLFTQGVFETTLVFSSTVGQEVDMIFTEEKSNCQIANLSAISLLLEKNGTEVPGIYYYIIKKLSWKGINIIEVITTAYEFTFVVRSQDADMTFSILNSLGKD